MGELMIAFGFVSAVLGGFLAGRIYGARTMARTLVQVGTVKYGKDFKQTMTKGFIDLINEHRSKS